jgi:hypothetical protein
MSDWSLKICRSVDSLRCHVLANSSPKMNAEHFPLKIRTPLSPLIAGGEMLIVTRLKRVGLRGTARNAL